MPSIAIKLNDERDRESDFDIFKFDSKVGRYIPDLKELSRYFTPVITVMEHNSVTSKKMYYFLNVRQCTLDDFKEKHVNILPW